MARKTNWKKALWDKLSNDAIRKKLEALPEKLQADLFGAFGLNSNELRKMGWREVCLGCGTPYDVRDCDCRAGLAWRPPENALE